ncbi:putative guanylate kinase [Babesia bovis T2Bo]|uniref:guanylate kinase n=1 Tax=Babesia bovis TaxID=5865 RepID=A7AUF5_BABBO|nr:putative guanylate kinase [Babesia bovis T2Bo]EDO06566.1 putative guanylate kinase [Babesia bovis T2Bo]|eukprot:XP_001610134.1 guanylate kinase [Babesia bovis T2Bo]
MAQVPFLVIVGPSGVGKTTLYKMLLEEFQGFFELSVSCTTRKIRPHEIDGVNYYFITEEKFNQMKDEEAFLECATYVGNQYGTPCSEITRIQSKGKVPLLEIEVCGFQKIKSLGIPLYSVFVSTSDIDALRKRLVRRGSDEEQTVDKRIGRAVEEIAEAKHAGFSMILYNDVLEVAYKQLREQIIKWYGLKSEQ